MSLDDLKEKLLKEGKLSKSDIEGLSEDELRELLLSLDESQYEIRDGPENQY